MTAFASAILAALPGAGVQPEKAGANGVSGGEGVLGVFEALLAGLTDGEGEAFTGLGAGVTAERTADQDGKTAAQTADILPDGAPVDPALGAAAAVVLPFAPLTQTLPTAETAETAEAAAAVGEGNSAAAVLIAPTAEQTVEADATAPAPTRSQVTAAGDVSVPAAATIPDAPAAQAGAEPVASAAPDAVLKAEVAAESPLFTADDLAPAAEGLAEAAPRVAAAPAAPVTPPVSKAAPTPAPSPSGQAEPPKAGVQTASSAQVTATVVQAASAPEAGIDPVVAVAPGVVADAETDAGATSAPAQVAAAPTPPAPSAQPATAGDLRCAATTAKNDQASAVASYLDGLDGAEKTEAAPEATVAAVDAQPDTGLEFAPAPVDVAETDEPKAQAPAAEVRAATADTAAHDAAAPAASRASAETVAKLSADIVRKLDGQASSRFDLQLDPHGMGKVDVSIEIDRDGRLTAALSFDSAQAASDLKGRSAELRAALEQAGFDVADSALSFDLNGQNSPGFGGRETGEQPRAWSGRAFQTAQTGLDEADARAALSSRSRAGSGGVDIRI